MKKENFMILRAVVLFIVAMFTAAATIVFGCSPIALIISVYSFVRAGLLVKALLNPTTPIQ